MSAPVYKYSTTDEAIEKKDQVTRFTDDFFPCFSTLFRDMSVLARMRLVIRERGGFLALYRGIGPGTMRSFISNGTSMVVMANAQRKVSEWGLRD